MKDRGKGFSVMTARETKRGPKNERGGGGGERTKRLQTNPRFWKPAFASERSAWLARLVEQYWHVSIKGLFHTERSCMVRDTHLNFLQLMFILVQGKRIFFNFFWNAKVFPTPPRSLTCANFRVVFDSCSSFFAPWTAQKRLLRRLTQYDCLEQTL